MDVLIVFNTLQGRAVTEAVQKRVTVPEQYTVDGQLNCEMWALMRYLLK